MRKIKQGKKMVENVLKSDIESAVDSRGVLGYYDEVVELKAVDVIEELISDEFEYDEEEEMLVFQGNYLEELMYEKADSVTDIYNADLWEWAANTNGFGVEYFFETFGPELIQGDLTTTFGAAQRSCIESLIMSAMHSLRDDDNLIDW